MTEFWWGVLALPIIALAVAAAAAAVFGGWLLVEKWFEGRWKKLNAVSLPEAIGDSEMRLWTSGDLGIRGAFASVILSGGQVRGLRLGSAALFFAWGKNDDKDSRMIQRALRDALFEVAKAEHEAGK